MKTRSFFKPPLYTYKNRLTERKNKYEINLKDLLIPLFSAIIAVFLNQMFFENNRRVEAKIELEKELIKAQIPALNRILAFTYKYEIHVITFSTVPKLRYLYTSPLDGSVVREETVILEDEMESITISTPSFVSDSIKRKRLFDDLAAIISQRDYLDHSVYVPLDRLLTFLENNELPSTYNKSNLMNSPWTEEDIITKWDDLVTELRTATIILLNKL